MKKMRIKLKKEIVLLLSLTAAAAVFGWFFNVYLMKSFTEGTSRALMLFSVPAEGISRPLFAVSSADIQERIAAYYAAADLEYVSADFLVKRLETEKSDAAKRVILYVMKRKYPEEFEKISGKALPVNKYRDNREPVIRY